MITGLKKYLLNFFAGIILQNRSRNLDSKQLNDSRFRLLFCINIPAKKGLVDIFSIQGPCVNPQNIYGNNFIF